MTSTQTEPQTLSIEEIEALKWPNVCGWHPTWNRTITAPYGVARVSCLDSMPGNIRLGAAYLDDDTLVLWKWRRLDVRSPSERPLSVVTCNHRPPGPILSAKSGPHSMRL